MTRDDLDDSNCKPVTSKNNKPYYPCGLIANSVFNGMCISTSIWVIT